MCFLAVFPAAALAAGTPHLTVSLIEQTPLPAEPGTEVDIDVQIQNDGTADSLGNTVDIKLKAPFSLLPGEQERKSFQNIPASSSVTTTYKLFVSSDALSGSYDIEFAITSASGQFTKTVPLIIRGVPKIIIDDFSLDPQAIEAGGQTVMMFYLKNVGTGSARQVMATLNATPELTPLFSQGSVFIGELSPASVGIATMSISVGKDAEEKTYTTPLTITYLDEENTLLSSSFPLGIPVSGVIRLDILKIEPNFERQLLEIEVANKGTTEAKSVEGRLLVNGELVDIDYISQIGANKKTTFTFPLITEGSGNLELTFIGPGLQENTLSKNITFSFEGQKQTPDGTIFIVILIIVIVGLYFWRRSRRKSQK